MFSDQTHAERLQTEVNRDPSLDRRVASAIEYRDRLQRLLADQSIKDSRKFASMIKEMGFGLSADFNKKSLEEMRQAVEEVISELNKTIQPYEVRGISNAGLQVYRKQYASLPDNVKEKLAWDDVIARLLDNGREKLKQARNMPRGAVLFGVDSQGRALFKNMGEEPIMMAVYKDGRKIVITERDSQEFRDIENDIGIRKARWADYADTRSWAHEHGYEFFPVGSEDDKGFSDEMKQVTDNRVQEFLTASDDKRICRYVWLESGDSPSPHVQHAGFNPGGNYVFVNQSGSDYADAIHGGALLLRV